MEQTKAEMTINWTRPLLARFKVRYQQHLKAGQGKVFTFDGNQFYVGYAKYLIEFLEEELQ